MSRDAAISKEIIRLNMIYLVIAFLGYSITKHSKAWRTSGWRQDCAPTLTGPAVREIASELGYFRSGGVAAPFIARIVQHQDSA